MLTSGGHVLLTSDGHVLLTSDRHVLLTSDGHVLLSARRVRHARARWATQQTRTCRHSADTRASRDRAESYSCCDSERRRSERRALIGSRRPRSTSGI